MLSNFHRSAAQHPLHPACQLAFKFKAWQKFKFNQTVVLNNTRSNQWSAFYLSQHKNLLKWVLGPNSIKRLTLWTSLRSLIFYTTKKTAVNWDRDNSGWQLRTSTAPDNDKPGHIFSPGLSPSEGVVSVQI
jgi:hypothetical protein